MKLRAGFVSNSSSSSFVIKRHNLSKNQINQIINHQTIGAKLGLEYADDYPWSITLTDDEISGSTYIDNFDMFEFLDSIGVDKGVIEVCRS